MGGLWRKIPMTYGLMWIGSLALAGIPPFAGYFSKDIVLEAAWADHTWFGHYAYWMGIAAAFMTAFYSWRLLIMTFHGESRASKKVIDHAHESPAVMLGPLVVLAAGALFAGMIFYQGFVGSASHGDGHSVEHAVEQVVEEHSEDHKIVIAEDHAEEVKGEAHTVEEEAPAAHLPMSKEVFWGDAIRVRAENDTVEAAHNVPFWVKKLPLVVALLGIALAYLFYLSKPGLPERFKAIFTVPYMLFFNKWFFDEIYDRLFTQTAFKLGNFFWVSGDQNMIDRFGPDGSVKATQKLAGMFSRFQTGFVFQYAFVMMIAVIGILSWFVFRSGM